MKVSLGTPVADSRPPVDASFPIEADMAGPQTRPHLRSCPFPTRQAAARSPAPQDVTLARPESQHDPGSGILAAVPTAPDDGAAAPASVWDNEGGRLTEARASDPQVNCPPPFRVDDAQS
jgi:hypothetical protein